jgi:hypothetical protein
MSDQSRPVASIIGNARFMRCGADVVVMLWPPTKPYIKAIRAAGGVWRNSKELWLVPLDREAALVEALHAAARETGSPESGDLRRVST